MSKDIPSNIAKRVFVIFPRRLADTKANSGFLQWVWRKSFLMSPVEYETYYEHYASDPDIELREKCPSCGRQLV